MALENLTQITSVGISTGITFSGVTTHTGTIKGTDADFTGNVSVGGTLTYEDVTSIESVGIITAKTYLHVGAGVSVVGVTTSTGGFVGALTGNVTGNVTGTASGNATLSNNADNRVITGGSGNALNGESSLTFDGTTLTTTQFNVSTGANAFETSANVFKGASGQKGVYLRSALSSATTPSYSSVDDTNTGIFLPGSDVFAVTTGGTERVRIDSNGKLLLGTTTAGQSGEADALTVYQSGHTGITIRTGGTSNNTAIYFADGTTTDQNYRGAITYTHADDNLVFKTAAANHLRITSGGRLLVGHTASEAMFYTGLFQVQGTGSGNAAITVKTNQNDSGGPAIVLGKSRGSIGGQTVVQSGDELGAIYFAGADGTDTNSRGASIRCHVDGTPGSNDMPGRLQFFTTADGASTGTERLRITSGGISKFQNFGGGQIWLGGDSAHTTKVTVTDNGGTGNGNFIFAGPSGEHLRITSAGDVVIGATSATTVTGAATPFQVSGSDGYTGMSIIRTASAGAQFQFAAGSSGDNVSDNDGLGYIKFFGYHTNGYDEYARIHAEVEGAPGDGDAPGAIVFSTTADGASSVTERMRILPSGGITFNGDTSADNALNDYETGTWTAQSREGTIDNNQTCKYTKIGNMVWVSGAVNNFSTRSGTVDVGITNLPFTVAENAMGSAVFYRIANTDDAHVGTIANTSERIQFLVSSQGGSESWYYIDYEDLNSSVTQIKFSIWYRTTQ